MAIISNGTTIIDAGSLSSNTVGASQITDNTVGAAELNVSGNGTSGQALTSDADGSMTFTTISADPPTTYRAIGTYVMGRLNSRTDKAVDSTLAGSQLYAQGSRGVYTFDGGEESFFTGFRSGTETAHVNTGTWRCMTGVNSGNTSYNYATNGLWVRIS